MGKGDFSLRLRINILLWLGAGVLCLGLLTGLLIILAPTEYSRPWLGVFGLLALLAILIMMGGIQLGLTVRRHLITPLKALSEDMAALTVMTDFQYTPRTHAYREIVACAQGIEELCAAACCKQDESRRSAAKTDKLLDELRVSEERLALALEGTSDGLWDWQILDGTVYLSPSCYTMLGYEPYAFPSTFKDWMVLLHPDDKPQTIARYNVWDTDVHESEFRLQAKDGSWRWILSRGKITARNNEGHAVRMVGTHVDITGRKQAEQALMHAQSALQRANEELEKRVQERTEDLHRLNMQLTGEIEERRQAEDSLTAGEEVFRALIENINEVIYVVNTQGIITYVSPSIETLLGYAPSDVAGHFFREYIYPEDVPHFQHRFRETIDGQKASSEYRALHRSGQVRWLLISSRPVVAEGQVLGIQGVLTDITHRKHLLERVILSEKRAATGQFAAAVAHEINSPLQAIAMMLADIRKYHPDDTSLHDILDLIHDAFNSIRDTVRNLQDLNRPGMDDKRSCDVNEVIEKTVSLVSSYLKQSRVKVELDLSPRLPFLFASPQQLSQVFFNLINNAFESITGLSHPPDDDACIQGGGIIHIRTALNTEAVLIEVTDTGPGISEEDLLHIFEPFFTRKKRMGMGVGLPICLGIVEDHKGTIEVGNNLEGGARFVITLPAHKHDEELSAAPSFSEE